MEKVMYPRMVAGPMIEVPSPKNGKPGYRWVQGWVIEYDQQRKSTPERYSDAREMLREAKATSRPEAMQEAAQ